MVKTLLIILIFMFAGCASGDKKMPGENPVATVAKDGETLFKANCSSCHKPDMDFVAPPLKGSLKRWGDDKKAMYAFIRNPSKSISENAYARKMAKKWQGMMTSFNLSDEKIDAIMHYCENYRSHSIED